MNVKGNYVTTYIVDSGAGACDSLWSDRDGQQALVELNKYLYVPSGVFSSVDGSTLIFYSGSYEQIILHMAFVIGILNEDQYGIWSSNCSGLGYDSFSYVEIAVDEWDILSTVGAQIDLGIIYGGSGGQHAYSHYREHYNVTLAVSHAIAHDERSGPPVCFYNHTLDGEDTHNLVETASHEASDRIYSLVEELILAIQNGQRGGSMNEVRYSGCTTSIHPEAPAIDVSKVIAERKASRDKMKKKLKSRRKSSTSRPRVTVKKMVI